MIPGGKKSVVRGMPLSLDGNGVTSGKGPRG